MIDGDLLASFLAFGETCNMTRAARAVGISQPAFFERLQRLSDGLGHALYDRKGRELVLTDAGRRLLAYAREHAAHHAALVAELRGDPPTQAVTLAAGEGAYLFLLGPALSRFTGARLDLLTCGASATLDALRSGEAQLGVAVIDVVPRGIAADVLVTTPLCVALPARHPSARAKQVALTDLRGARWILSPEGQLHRDLVSRAVARHGDALTHPLEADGWPLTLHFVALGLGVAIVNGTCTPPKGVAIRPVPELGHVTYRVLQRASATLSPDAKRLADSIRSSVSR
jgi:LysR family transcriptional regulator, low CO2-responsive transcriptional regulator